ncbi:NADPH-dependent FMN reductase family protein [Gluconacetobacter tumulisoli]|uniref:hypothetical protein n=1 Tax=Gluconacetobacter tumulisoli TaxID=1286189 RepID=UPI0030846D48
MAVFWDQTGRLIGKVGTAFISTAMQLGSRETPLFLLLMMLLYHGMVINDLPCSETEPDGARFLGDRVARLTAKIAA